jgi:hypothetical protein
LSKTKAKQYKKFPPEHPSLNHTVAKKYQVLMASLDILFAFTIYDEYIREIRNIYTILAEKSDGNKLPERQMYNGRIILE